MTELEQLTIEEILNLDGIVIRKIPATTTQRCRTLDKAYLLPPNAKVIERKGGMMSYEEVKENALAGYAITFDLTQGSRVQFSKRTDGFGPTVEAAYADFVKKNGAR